MMYTLTVNRFWPVLLLNKTETIKYHCSQLELNLEILIHAVIEYTVNNSKITLILVILWSWQKLTVIVSVQAAKHESKAFLMWTQILGELFKIQLTVMISVSSSYNLLNIGHIQRDRGREREKWRERGMPGSLGKVGWGANEGEKQIKTMQIHRPTASTSNMSIQTP